MSNMVGNDSIRGMQVLFCGSGWLDMVEEIRRRLPAGIAIRAREPGPLAAQLADVDVILPSNARIDAAAIAAPRRLLLVQQPAAGYEGIDLEAARARGVPVCNAPGANVEAVAELTLFLLLALARRLPLARRAFAAARIGTPVGFELAGRTLALVGEGRIGGRVRQLAEAIGMNVRSVRSAATRADLLGLVDGADFVSLHCPLTPRTRGLIDAALLARMKPGAGLINCARGAIVDRAALEAALGAGQLGGVGLDCFWDEPWDPDDPLFARPDVVAMPHVAGSTAEAFAGLAEIVAENIRRAMAGEDLRHRIV
jgi:phosphoglycerate dehydrogenase-like enzyme